MITDPRSSLTETEFSRGVHFPAKIPLITTVGEANRQSPAISRKSVALYHRNTKIRMRFDEQDN